MGRRNKAPEVRLIVPLKTACINLVTDDQRDTRLNVVRLQTKGRFAQRISICRRGVSNQRIRLTEHMQ
jgi:hypothetical protein